MKLVSGKALAGLFKLVADQVKCVLLNSCFTEAQGLAIGKVIPLVIGTTTEISNDAGRAFSQGFYQALGDGKGIVEAFEWGRTQVGVQGYDDEMDLFVLLVNGARVTGALAA